jgi:Cu2+-exporting ATPase
MDYAVRHFIPGRIRLCIPSLCRRRTLAEATLAWLGEQKGIKRARVNYGSASLVIEYDAAHDGLLRAMLGRLSVMSLDELRILVKQQRVGANGQPTDIGRPAPSSSTWWRPPLALPSLSLLMAFSVNPVMLAVNVP